MTASRVLTKYIVVLLLSSPVAAGSACPELVWTVSDDQLAVPLGSILDVAVDAEQTVYLLDAQNMAVRPFSRDGSELPWLGREGEGPGEFVHPRLVASVPGGGCVVLQDFYSPAVALSRNGDVKRVVDVSLIRGGFMTTLFMGSAHVDATGRLTVAASTTTDPYDATSPNARVDEAVSVFRISQQSGAAEVLFTDHDALAGESSIKYDPDIGYYALRSWDVDDTGRLIYADPTGAYRVFVGHPADGKPLEVELTENKADIANLANRAKRMGRSLAEMPRIVDVQWVGRNLFLVKPTGATPDAKIWQSGTFELFDTDGKTHGRCVLAPDYEPEQDMLFLRGSLAILVRGGLSAVMAHVGARAKKPQSGADELLVEAYRLALP